MQYTDIDFVNWDKQNQVFGAHVEAVNLLHWLRYYITNKRALKNMIKMKQINSIILHAALENDDLSFLIAYLTFLFKMNDQKQEKILGIAMFWRDWPRLYQTCYFLSKTYFPSRDEKRFPSKNFDWTVNLTWKTRCLRPITCHKLHI